MRYSPFRLFSQALIRLVEVLNEKGMRILIPLPNKRENLPQVAQEKKAIVQ